MPASRFDRVLDKVRGVKARFKDGGEGDEGRGGGHPAVDPRRAPDSEFRSKRKELSEINKEVRAVKRSGVEREEKLEQVRRAKRKQQEIFRLRHELRVAEDPEGEPGIGALPDFVVIGPPKCGTTFFYHLLTKHPYVEAAACKEPGYFDLLYEEGIEWYRNCFPAPRWKDGRRTVTGEATPSYLYHPEVPARMAETVPQTRLMALLRNPVERTYSAYYHRVRNGKETRTFEETVEVHFNNPDRGPLSRAIYVDYLLRWSEFFGDEQMLVLKSEDLFEHPREVLRRVLAFLDLPYWEPEDWELGDKRNKGGYEQKIDPAVRRRLEEYFEPHNRRLYDYIGADFGW